MNDPTVQDAPVRGTQPNGALSTVDGRPAVRIERRLAHPPGKVWRAITDPEQLSQWYPFRVTELELRVGGTITFDDGAGMVMSATVVELDEPRVFAFSEHAPEGMHRESDDLVRMEIVPDGAGCTLVFTHVFDDRPAAASYCTGWNACLDALMMLVAGRDIAVDGDMAARHEEFATRFRLSAGVAEVTADGWRVRFERQLTRPAATVWAELGGTGAGKPGAEVPSGFRVPAFDPGSITDLATERTLEYPWLGGDGHPAGRVRWEFSAGIGQGARVVLTQTGTGEQARDTALRQWESHLDEFAAALLRTPG